MHPHVLRHPISLVFLHPESDSPCKYCNIILLLQGMGMDDDFEGRPPLMSEPDLRPKSYVRPPLNPLLRKEGT